MLQTAYDRASRLGDVIYVVTESSHSDHVRGQLPELLDSAFLIEPGRRGTAHCIVFALDVIARTHDHDEPIAFIHSDHHVRDIGGFARSFAMAAKVSQKNNQIALIGIEPTFPSTSFGYIERDGVINASTIAYNVQSFKEKPDYETAQTYVESGNYLWNCGYFVGSVNTFLGEMRLSAPDLLKSFEILRSFPKVGIASYDEAYLAFDNKVIDIAKKLKPSPRGELEITSVNNEYIKRGRLKVQFLTRGHAWLDTGTYESLIDASTFIRTIEERQGLKVGCIEEIAYRKGYINKKQLLHLAAQIPTSYGEYLRVLSRNE